MRVAPLIVVLVLLALPALAVPGATPPGGQAPAAAAEQSDRPSVARARAEAFDRVWRLTAERFFDPELRGVDWAAARSRYAGRAESAADDRAFAAVVNEMLGELGSSHTRFYTDRDPEYYFLRAVFRDALRQPIPEWDDGGLVTVRLPDGGTFVRDVLDGGPAARAGVRVGDRIVEPNGPFDLVGAFEGRSGRPVPLVVQTERGGAPRRVEIVPRRTSAQRAYVDATRASVRRMSLPDGGEAGYVRLWALTHPLFVEALEEALVQLGGTVGLVLDLRGGYGGRSEDYLDIFLRAGSGRVETVDRKGQRKPFFAAWDGPLVVLVDGGTRSAKELLAYSLRRAGRARLVGTRTAGAVLASIALPIDDRSLLLVAVADLLADGVRIEGRGVPPDVVVEAPLPYRKGDPQLAAALAEVETLAATRRRAEATAAP